MEDYIQAIKSVNVDSVLAFWAEDSRFLSNNNDITGKVELRELLTNSYKGLHVTDVSSKTTMLEVTDQLY